MKRMGVFICYDKDGIVDGAEEHLLKSLAEILDRFVVVVNGWLSDESIEIIKKYSHEIVMRKNEGFDGGAYQDYLLNHLHKEELLDYDELLLANDTYYGPFYPWKEVFEPMEKAGYDFWGLTRHLSYFDQHWNTLITEHIQGYFLVFTRSVFTNERFFTYWEQLPELHDRNDAILKFEVPLTDYYRSLGYSYGVYTDVFPQQDYMKRAENMYIAFCYSLLKDFHLPILKKRDGVNFQNPQTYPAIEYIREHYANYYHINYLWENAKRTLKSAEPFFWIDDFYYKYDLVYIYGHGKIGRAIENYFNVRDWKIAGFIETEPMDEQSIAWKDFHLDENIGIIVALGRKNTNEVKQFLPETDAIKYVNL